MTSDRRFSRSGFARVLASGLALLTAPLLAGNSMADTVSMRDYSVVTIGSAGDPSTGTFTTTSEVTGKVFTSGLFSANSTSIGSHLPTVSGAPQYSLTAAGGVSIGQFQGVHIHNGYSVLASGSVSSNGFDFQGGGSLHSGADLASVQHLLYQQVTTVASTLAGMASTGSVIAESSNDLVLKYTNSGIAVFSLTYSQLSSYQHLKLDAPSASSIIINIVSSNPSSPVTDYAFPQTIAWQGNFDFAHASKILWNFQGLTSLSTTNQFYGSILAPTATFSNSTAVDGSVWVQAYHGTGEVHYLHNSTVVAYQGYLPSSPVPEPGSLALLSIAAGFVAVGVARRRHAA